MLKPLVFIFLVVIAPGISEAMFYFETDILGFQPNIFGWINAISSAASIIGVWSYRIFFATFPLNKYLLVTTITLSIVQASNILLVEQKTGIGPIPFALVNTFCYSLINELHLMPLMVLACYLCPKRIETTFYALVMATINLGYLLSYWIGTLLTWCLGIADNDDFSKFWILILISSIWPLLTLLYLLILPSKLNYIKVKTEHS